VLRVGVSYIESRVWGRRPLPAANARFISAQIKRMIKIRCILKVGFGMLCCCLFESLELEDNKRIPFWVSSVSELQKSSRVKQAKPSHQLEDLPSHCGKLPHTSNATVIKIR
jgi:hypothetical protein